MTTPKQNAKIRQQIKEKLGKLHNEHLADPKVLRSALKLANTEKQLSEQGRVIKQIHGEVVKIKNKKQTGQGVDWKNPANISKPVS